MLGIRLFLDYFCLTVKWNPSSIPFSATFSCFPQFCKAKTDIILQIMSQKHPFTPFPKHKPLTKLSLDVYSEIITARLHK